MVTDVRYGVDAGDGVNHGGGGGRRRDDGDGEGGTLDHAVRTEGTAVTVTVSAGTASASDFAPVSAFTLTIDADEPPVRRCSP